MVHRILGQTGQGNEMIINNKWNILAAPYITVHS